MTEDSTIEVCWEDADGSQSWKYPLPPQPAHTVDWATYRFTEGPIRTRAEVESVLHIIRQVGTQRQYLSRLRRAGLTLATQPFSFGEFTPSHLQSTDREPPADELGWELTHVLGSPGASRTFGWRAIFEVHDDSTARRVMARVEGSSERREAKRFVQAVFDSL